MNRHNVIQMAHKVMPEIASEITDEELEGFAKLVAAAERESCLSILLQMERRKWAVIALGGELSGCSLHDAYMAIRARGEEPKRHPGYIVGDHWLQTAYSRICAGDDEAEVMADYGYKRGQA